MTPQDILEQAKQGDPKAIAELINRQLQPKGITAKADFKDGLLQVMLESSQVPDQQTLVAFIRKGVTGLECESIKRVMVWGKQIGEEFPAWNQEFDLGTQSNLIPSPTKQPSILSPSKTRTTQTNSTTSPTKQASISSQRGTTSTSKNNGSVSGKTYTPASQAVTISLNLSGINISDRAKILGIIGAIILIIGVFCPIFSAPIVGNVNYIGDGRRDGVLLIVLSAVSMFLIYRNNYNWLWLTALISFGVLVIGFKNFQSNLSENDSVVQLEWGWILLVLGVSLLIASAVIKQAKPSRNVYLVGGIIGLVIFVLVLGTTLSSLVLGAGLIIATAWIKRNPKGIKKLKLLMSIIGLCFIIYFVMSHLNQAAIEIQQYARSDLKLINTKQTIFYMENEKFASTFEELERTSLLDDESYTYNIFYENEDKVVITATAKRWGLKSYTSLVIAKQLVYSKYPDEIICETNKPSHKPPVITQFLGENLQCPAGSFDIN